ncbi:MAG: sugar transferase [Acidobacteriia bacterium]|nr:sugar transferase [Terriglobia bacterium]
MLSQFSTRRIVGFFLIDWLGTLGMLVLAARLRAQFWILPAGLTSLLRDLRIPVGGVPDPVALRDLVSLPLLFAIVSIIWPFYLIVFSAYDGRRNDRLKAELMNVFLAICASSITLAATLYLTYRGIARVLFVMFFVFDVALLLGSRVILWTARKRWRIEWHSRRRNALVVGAGLVGQNTVKELSKHSWANINLVGYLDDDPNRQGQKFEGVAVIGTLDQLIGIVKGRNIDVAVLALPLRAHERVVYAAETCQKLSVRVYVIPDLFALSFPSATLDGFGGIPVIDLGEPGIYGWRRSLKRIFDTVAASTVLFLLSPILLLLAAAIKLDSEGPVFYKQQRVGENGRLFYMLKFRSMKSGSDPEPHKKRVAHLIEQNAGIDPEAAPSERTLKLVNDPRVTRVGRFIRKTSLDELAQLINVLRGEMSLVGPRPAISYEVELYKDWHRRRFEAIPGMTGMWQVKGRNRVSFDEMVRMDLDYIQNQSIWLDIKILLLTPMAVLTGRGAG